MSMVFHMTTAFTILNAHGQQASSRGPLLVLHCLSHTAKQYILLKTRRKSRKRGTETEIRRGRGRRGGEEKRKKELIGWHLRDFSRIINIYAADIKWRLNSALLEEPGPRDNVNLPTSCKHMQKVGFTNTDLGQRIQNFGRISKLFLSTTTPQILETIISQMTLLHGHTYVSIVRK